MNFLSRSGGRRSPISFSTVLVFGLIGALLMFGFPLLGKIKEAIFNILAKFGLVNNKNDDAVDGAIANSGDPNSPWNPNFWRQYLGHYTNPMTNEQAQAICTQIWNAAGAFDDDEDAMIAAVKKCRTKGAVSFVCYWFSNMHAADLLTWFQGGVWPNDRLSNEDLSRIISYVNSLPNY